MPRVKIGQPERGPGWKDLENRIVERYGMLLTTAALGRVLGMANYPQIKKWAADEGLVPRRINNRNRWDARDVAKAVTNCAGR